MGFLLPLASVPAAPSLCSCSFWSLWCSLVARTSCCLFPEMGECPLRSFYPVAAAHAAAPLFLFLSGSRPSCLVRTWHSLFP